MVHLSSASGSESAGAAEPANDTLKFAPRPVDAPHGMAVGGAGLRARLTAWHDAARGLDDVALAGRVGAVLFLAAGTVGLALHLLPRQFAAPVWSLPVALAALMIGAWAWRVDWSRRSVDAQLTFPLTGFALTAAMAHAGPRTGTASVIAAFTLLFALTGFSQPPGRSLLLAPMALLAMLLALDGSPSSGAVVETLLELATSVAIGEAIALVVRREQRAERRIHALLDAVQTMNGVEEPSVALQTAAKLAVNLLDADAAAVLLRADDSATRLQVRARAGHPALANFVPETVRAGDGALAAALDAGRVVVLDDTGGFVDPARTGPATQPSVAVLPLANRRSGAFGCVVVLWHRPSARCSRTTGDAAELLAQETARMFARIARQRQLVAEARTDALTRLANRRTFARALDALAPDDVVVVLDLDHFKQVNDTFGHTAGDELLQQLADCLRRVARSGDVVARYGGEEFALVLPRADEHGALALLTRLRRAWDGQTQAPVTTFSAGIAVHRAGRRPVETLAAADTALYEAKRAGRNRDVVAAPADGNPTIDLRAPADGRVSVVAATEP